MNRAKLMLMAIAALAITGGVLAFKAKSAFHGRNYCVTDPQLQKGFCSRFIISIIPSDMGDALLDYTTADVNNLGITTDAGCRTLLCPYDDYFALDIQ